MGKHSVKVGGAQRELDVEESSESATGEHAAPRLDSIVFHTRCSIPYPCGDARIILLCSASQRAGKLRGSDQRCAHLP